MKWLYHKSFNIASHQEDSAISFVNALISQSALCCNDESAFQLILPFVFLPASHRNRVAILAAGGQHLQLVLPRFLLFQTVGLKGGEVVHSRKLDQGRRHKRKTHGDEPVHGRGIGHFGKRLPGTDAQGGHGQHCGDAWGKKKKKDLCPHTSLVIFMLGCISATSRRSSAPELLLHCGGGEIPATVRAGTDSLLIQNETCDSTTIMMRGM